MLNEKLCWSRYDWSAISGEVEICGDIVLSYYPTRDKVTQIAIGRTAMMATKTNLPWDPFNCTVVVRRRRDPNPMFTDPETGEVYE